jgi:D-apionolactonase
LTSGRYSHGTAADEPEAPAATPDMPGINVTRAVGAGQFSAELSGPDLFAVRWSGFEILSRLHATVRDATWNTVPPTLRSVRVEEHPAAAVVWLQAEHSDGDVAFAWHGSIELGPGGRLAFSLDGIAERDFEYRRIGICVLHPWSSYVGAQYRATRGARVTKGAFPHEIAPQLYRHGILAPMIDAFSRLDVSLTGINLTMRFDGDLFECEDQRNWTDASFKTYPTPLARSGVRMIRAGTEISQRVVVEVAGLPAPDPVEAYGPGGSVRIAVGGSPGRLMPPVGIVAPRSLLTEPAIANLRRLDLAHVRAELAVTAPEPSEAPLRLVDAAAALGVPIELALLIGDGARLPGSLDAVAALLHDRRLARLLVHLQSGVTTPGSVVHEVRDRLAPLLGGTPVAGGTSSHFSELNRLPPEPGPMDEIAFAISAGVHQTDERSMTETLEVQDQVVRRARGLAGGVPVTVTPITLLPQVPGVDGSPGDPRVGTPFGAAWTLGSLATLAAAGANSMTFHDAVGAGGVIDAGGAPTPTYHVLAAAAALRGGRLLAVRVSHRRELAALAVRLAGGVTVLLANLTNEPRVARLQSGLATGGAVVGLGPYGVQRLDAGFGHELQIARLV